MRKWAVSSTARSETKSFRLHFVVSKLEGGSSMRELPNRENYGVEIQIEWNLPRKGYLSRRAMKTSHTSKKGISSTGSVHWNEGFDQDCKLKTSNDSTRLFRACMVNLEVRGSRLLGLKNKASVLAKLKLDVTEFAGLTECSEKTVVLPVKGIIGSSIFEANLTVIVTLAESRMKHLKNTISPLSPSQLLPSCARIQSENECIDTVSSIWASDEDPESAYGSIVATNLLAGGPVNDKLEYNKVQAYWEENGESSRHQAAETPSLIRMLSWNKRGLTLRVTDHPRDKPLLNKAYGEAGGDDIDNDRRCSQSSLSRPHNNNNNDTNALSFVESDRFEIGKWEKRKFTSRDGKLELETEIFLASIDQRSERASGEGACAVLAISIADWLHQNPKILPLRCQFDKLIREGSSEWRNLWKDETHEKKFLDKHFDLETVLKAQIRPLMVVPEKSYVGFFDLENMPNQLEFLQGTMSFNSIWDEMEHSESTSEERVYIVSWNDHFFVLKVEKEAIYIIDTLGERLAEGCKKAYILKFNKESKVYTVQPGKQSMKKVASRGSTRDSHSNNNAGKCNCRICQRLLTCEGKSTCKEFIRGFLAALPLRELQANIERGINEEAPVHQCLQIEFQYTIPINKSPDNMEIKHKGPSQQDENKELHNPFW